MESIENELFPHPEFREKQFSTLKACLNALDNGYKNIVLDAPTGTGKSAINTALLRYAEDGFYTTPQKGLRKQIQDDEALKQFVEDLKARRDYFCNPGNDNCKDCSIYNSEDKSCAEQNAPPCNYWRRKQTVMSSNIAVLTFSMMIIDGMIPTHVNDMQVSFDDRDMIVVDEAHGLVEQTRQMHAGVDIAPYTMPDSVVGNIFNRISWDANRYEDIRQEIQHIHKKLDGFVRDIPEMEMSDEEKRCNRLKNKIEQIEEDYQNDNVWTVDVENKNYYGSKYKVVEIRPVNVGGFLKNFVWDRADKRIVSTATLRHRNNPDIWLRNVGLDPEETKVISVGMSFPIENRPVVQDRMIASMSDSGCDKNWDSILDELNDIVEMHVNKKGICHTVSYDRAAKVEETVTEESHPYLNENVYVHTQDEDADVAVEQWQDSDLDLMLSPSMMEGIDLAGDKGRYNILMKVPYPAIDSTTEYLLNETDYGWNTYYDRAAIRVAQAYGRTNRSKDDYSNFYILDEDYNKLKKKAALPKWLLEAEEANEVPVKSVFDY